jgi:hypothetical protein
MISATKVKFEEDDLNYSWDWSEFLEAEDTVVSASITAAPSGLVIGTTTIDATATQVSAFISSGLVGQAYQVLCTIGTVGGLVANSVMTLLISETAR